LFVFPVERERERESGEDRIKSRGIKAEINKFNLAIWVQRGGDMEMEEKVFDL
jgi:hypothetical protein